MTTSQWFTTTGVDSAAADAALERLTEAWGDAPTTNLETLGMLVEVARDQVWAYAPESHDDDGEPVTVTITAPARLVYAQLQQAINLWNAGRVSSDGDLGDGGFTFTPRPLDKTIKSIIRPVSVPNAC